MTEAQRASHEVQNTIFAADVAHGSPQANTSYSLPQGSSAGIYIEYANALPSDAFGATLVKDGVVVNSCPPKQVGSANGNYWCQLGVLPVGRYNLNLSINGNPINTTSFSITSPVSYQQSDIPSPGVVVAGVAQQAIPEDRQNWSTAVAIIPGFILHENVPFGANVAKDCHYATDNTWRFCGTTRDTVNGPIDAVRYIAQPPQPISVSYYYTRR
jgi:hypothetical protein